MAHTLKILCIYMYIYVYWSRNKNTKPQGINIIEWVGGKLEVRIPYSKKLNLAWLRACWECWWYQKLSNRLYDSVVYYNWLSVCLMILIQYIAQFWNRMTPIRCSTACPPTQTSRLLVSRFILMRLRYHPG